MSYLTKKGNDFMKFKVYSMYDEVAQVYNQPIYFVNDAVLERSVRSAISAPGAANNPNSLVHTIRDMKFYYIADFDDETGKFTPIDVPELALSGASFVTRKE